MAWLEKIRERFNADASDIRPSDVGQLLAHVDQMNARAILDTSALQAECEGRHAAEARLADPWDLEGNAAAMAWKKRVDAVQAWAEQEYGDASAFPTGLVFALFGSVAAELHEVTTDARS